MVKRAQTFEELHQNRKKWVESSEINGFNEGILKLLTELYPDKAHFVYELLQNAEDAKATSVSFQLYPDRLEFVHNGSRLFSLDDIDSITSIANTTKNKEDHTIGKFGVGFKAVFSYTQSPQIRSGKWNFEINKLVIPTPIEPLKNIDTQKTYFTFPFNNPKKEPEKAYKETEIGLKRLPPETLLFLNNIQELTWIVNNEEHKIYKKEQDHIVSLYIDNHIAPWVQYLRFTKNNITIKTSSGRVEHLSIALAYKLDEDNNKKLKIVPITSTESNVFIYFPAEKENSKLRFLINAPFDSEVSRASIRDTEDNELLLKEIVNLQAETMVYLRDNGYLTTEFLGVLPNSKDKLPEIYEIFHKKLIELFNNEDFTPTESGKFRPAKELYKGTAMYSKGPNISKFINEDELYEMLKAKNDDALSYNKKEIGKKPQWSKNVLQNTLADDFLQDLELNKFGVKEFCKWFEEYSYYSEKRTKIWKKIIENKNFNELTKLYRMFYQYFEDFGEDITYELSDYELFRCTNGKMYNSNVKIYIKPNKELSSNVLNSYHFIDDHSFGTDATQKNSIKSLFTDYFGISEFSAETMEQEKFNKLCSKYSKKDLTISNISVESHISDMKFLIQYLKKHDYITGSSSGSVNFLLTTDNEYVSEKKVYLDTRYGNGNDLLKEVKDILGLAEINNVYKERLDDKQLVEFKALLAAWKVQKTLRIKMVNCWDNPNEKLLRSTKKHNYSTYEMYDANIEHLSNLIKKIKHHLKISQIIWNFILEINISKYPTQAYYKANKSDEKRYVPAQYIYTLTKEEWIYGKDGRLHKPEDMTFDDLPDGNWKIPSEKYEHPILKDIGFGKNTEKQRKIQKQNDQAAQALGLENEEEAKIAAELYKLLGKDAAKSKIDELKKEKSSNLPSSTPQNPERRKEKVIEEQKNAPDQKYEIKERSVRITDTQVKKDAREYLITEYTNKDDKVMCCQMCQKELPFKKKDGQYYFETIQIFNNMEKENKRQFLALCPNCAAEYDEWVRKDEKNAETLLTKIKERSFNGEESVKILFSIHDEPYILYFTGKHYFDLRNVICSDTENCSWEDLDQDNIPLQIGDTVRTADDNIGEVVEIVEGTDKVKIKFSNNKEPQQYIIDFLKKKMN